MYVSGLSNFNSCTTHFAQRAEGSINAISIGFRVPAAQDGPMQNAGTIRSKEMHASRHGTTITTTNGRTVASATSRLSADPTLVQQLDHQQAPMSSCVGEPGASPHSCGSTRANYSPLRDRDAVHRVWYPIRRYFQKSRFQRFAGAMAITPGCGRY